MAGTHLFPALASRTFSQYQIWNRSRSKSRRLVYVMIAGLRTLRQFSSATEAKLKKQSPDTKGLNSNNRATSGAQTPNAP
jgi:hypothetical protein